jgi:two-component system response regulator MprA
MRILLVEDDRQVADYIRRGLEEENNSVTVCYDGAAGLKTAQTSHFDVIVLDVMMPFIDGLEATRRLRLSKIDTPILLLTARDAPEDIVRGLNAGADDYLVKPFTFEVLLARLRARTRASAADHLRLQVGDLVMDLDAREVRRGNRVLSLTRTEFSLLECLLRAAGRVVTRERLIETIWGEREISDNNLEVFIRFLRNKVDAPGCPKMIQTERGVGYYLRERA